MVNILIGRYRQPQLVDANIYGIFLEELLQYLMDDIPEATRPYICYSMLGNFQI